MTRPDFAGDFIAAALGFIFIPPRAAADENNRKIAVTFDEPVEIPGALPPAGTCVFKLIDTYSSQDQIIIRDEGEGQLRPGKPIRLIHTRLQQLTRFKHPGEQKRLRPPRGLLDSKLTCDGLI